MTRGNFSGFSDTNGSPNLGQTTRPSNSQQKKNKTKKKQPNSVLCCLCIPQSKIKRRWKEGQNSGHCQRTEEALKHESNGVFNCQRVGKETGRCRNHRTHRDHPENNIPKIGQYTEKSPGDVM